jgi:hypothetical protein
MVARMVTVEGLVSVKQITFSNQAAIKIAFAQINCCLTIMLDMWKFLPNVIAKSPMEYKQLSVTEYDTTTQEG